ncbi:MAG: methyltransferase [Microbacteriaceae bacterium]|nr:methyltransferase [Microbacteriaceae bacterium]
MRAKARQRELSSYARPMGAPVKFTTATFASVAHLSPAQQAISLGCSIRTVQRHYAAQRDTTAPPPTILDPASGSRMFYFDPQDSRVIFGDIRSESHLLSDGRTLDIRPDLEMDFRALPFADGSFRLVIFDPPHLLHAGGKSWLARKYGRLGRDTWRDDLRRGFNECFRVLSVHGVLVFKWNQIQIPTSEVLTLAGRVPVIGHRSGRRSGTHWMLFMK